MIGRIFRENAERTILCHWETEKRLSDSELIDMVTEDYALKCASVLSGYADPLGKNVKLSLGVYEVLNNNWGIERWSVKGYLDRLHISGKDEREKSGLYEKMFKYLQRIGVHQSYSVGDLRENADRVLGAGEAPFLVILERQESETRWNYVYYITR